MRLISVLLVVVAACGDAARDGGPNSSPDASLGADGGGGSSDAAAQSGLVIEWVDSPMIPGPQNLPAMVDVATAKFHVDRLEAISDGGAVPEATQNDFDVMWMGFSSPPTIQFFNAPPAIYSKVRIGLDKSASNAPSIEITGTVLVGGATESFRVTSSRKLDLEVSGYNVTLSIGGSQGMPVLVGLDVLLADIDWMSLPKPGNVRLLEDASANEMDALFSRLEDTFVGPNE